MKILFAIRDLDFYNPMGITQLSSVIKENGHNVYSTILSRENIFDKINEVKPDIIGYSSCSGEHRTYLELNKKIKSGHKNIFTIMGGAHPTFFPEVLEEGNLDAICVGEGEYPFKELVEKLDSGEDISNIMNIQIRGKKSNGLRPLIQDLDKLPYIDRDLFDLDKTIPIMNLIATRGCPYNCSYCYNHAYKKMFPNQRYVRRRSIDNVIDEIVKTKNKFSHIKFVRFMDDALVLKEDDYFKDFCKVYKEKVNLPFYIFTRFDTLTESIANQLKEAGCATVFMSIETTNQRIRKDILKRNMSDEDIINGMKLCKKYGINVVGNSMLGLPTSKLEDDINAVDFSIKLGFDVPEFPIFQPSPKTDIHKFCIEEGILKEDENYNYYGFTNKSMLNFTEKEKNAQININALGPLTVKHPWLRDLVMNYLIYLPHNVIYKKIYALDKILTYPKKVFPMKYSFKERVRIIRKALGIEKTRRKEE